MAKLLSKQDYERRIETSKWVISFIAIMTIFNVFLLGILGDEDYFISSSAIAIHIVNIGKIFTGKMDNDFYVGKWADIQFLSGEFLYGMMAIGIVIGLIFLICGILTKKHVAFTIVGAVLILVDTVCMFFVYSFTYMTYCDLAIHIAMFIICALAIDAHIKLKRFAEQEKALIKSFSHDHRLYR